MSDEANYPGREIVLAAAGVVSEAGKSLARALGRLANAGVSSVAAGAEARALEKKRNIAHDGRIQRAARELEARRNEELTEVEHQLALQRALGRKSADFVHEQLKLEALTDGAFERIEADSGNNKASDIDPDWLRRFFKYATETDEATILSVFEAALADAAIGDRPALPFKALDTLRFFDRRSFTMFRQVADIIALFGHCEQQIIEEFADAEGFEIDLALLDELGLTKPHTGYYSSAQIGSFYITLSYDVGTIYRFNTLQLTQAGAAIIRLTDKPTGELLSNFSWPQHADRFWDIQKTRLTEKRVRTLANKLLAQVADSPEVSIHVKQQSGTDWVEIGQITRNKWDDPFGLGPACKPLPGGHGEDYFNQVTAIFDDFDVMTLPAMIGMRK